MLEQPFLGEIVLGIQQQDLAAWLVLLEVVRHHGRTLVGAGRAAERVVRNRHYKGAAVFHGLHLPAQQLRLRTGLPGMRSLFCGGLVVALQCTPAHIHAGR
ncbi:hypothetical protein SDC9_127622 [bioreactor metagenome]|uniref:Uncharacterized protein n=1 Tax=bioreactor metagenome TaxID=1076179 RepID=A0A645CUJ6_9ZZZZ